MSNRTKGFSAAAAMIASAWGGFPGPDDGPSYRTPDEEQDPAVRLSKIEKAAAKRERIRLRNLARTAGQ